MVLRLEQKRREAGLTQVQLAVKMGVAQNCVSSWEREVILPRTRDLPRLARVLGCQIGDLFTEDPEEPEEVGA